MVQSNINIRKECNVNIRKENNVDIRKESNVNIRKDKSELLGNALVKSLDLLDVMTSLILKYGIDETHRILTDLLEGNKDEVK